MRKLFAKNMEAKINTGGFSMVELVVALAIFVIVIVGIFTLGADNFYLNSVIQGSFSVQEEAKKILRPMTNEIRTAGLSDSGGYPIATAGTSTLTFYSDVDFDGQKEKVRYFLSGIILKKGVVEPSTGTNGMPVYTGTEKTYELVHGIRNSSSTPVFQYFDTNYNGTTAPLSGSFSLLAIRLVKINLVVDVNTNRSPVPQNITTQVSIRNLKDNL